MADPGQSRPKGVVEHVEAAAADVATGDRSLESVLSLVDPPSPEVSAHPSPRALVRAAPFRAASGGFQVQSGGAFEAASVAPFVDLEFLADCARGGYVALVECAAERPVIVGVAQVGRPTLVRLEAREVEIIANEQLTLKSGRAAMLLRQDGVVELLGTRISAASRGLLRLVGRALRLN